MVNSDDYVLIAQAAQILGVATNTVRAWGAAGKLPEYRHPVNNYRLFRKSDVLRLRKQIRQPERVNKPK